MESFLPEFVRGMTNVQAALVAVIVGLLTYFIRRKLKYKLPPGPRPIPIIGNWSIYSKPMMHRDIAKLSEKYGPVISITLGPYKSVILNRIDVVLEAMVKRKADFAGRPSINSADAFFARYGVDIIFGQYDPTWKFQKKVAGKALRYYMQGSHLEDMLNDVCDEAFKRMSEETGEFEAINYINKIVTHVLFNMCFSRKCAWDDPDVEYVLKTETDVIDKFGIGFIEDLLPKWMLKIYTTKRWKEVVEMFQGLLQFLEKQINEHKASFDPNNIRDYTDSILFARQEAEAEAREEETGMLADDNIVLIISDIFFAGLDTTRFTIDWFISFMIANPECQAKCQEEIDNNIGGNRKPRASDRPNLCFLEACMMETMRLGGVAALGVPHETICDTTVGGYDVPQGTMVMVNHWGLHNDPVVWKDAEKFDPYRYLDSNGQLDQKPESWLPFGAGRRICLGEPVARSELILIAANMLQNFTFKVPPGVNHVPEGVNKISGSELAKEYKVVIEKRKAEA